MPAKGGKFSKKKKVKLLAARSLTAHCRVAPSEALLRRIANADSVSSHTQTKTVCVRLLVGWSFSLVYWLSRVLVQRSTGRILIKTSKKAIIVHLLSVCLICASAFAA